MADSVEKLLIRIDATTESLRRELKAADAAVTQSASVVEKAQARMNASWQGANKYVKQHQTELKLLGAAAIGATALAVNAIIKYTDSYSRLQGQLKLVTDSQDELNRVYEGTKRIASDTGQTLESTITLYARMSRATEEMGLSENERLRITETINKALIVSGTSAQEAAGSLRQLSQALASGVLRGEEFNSMAENAPRLLKGIADSLGVSTGELRKMAKEGELTSDKVVKAIQEMGGSIDTEFSKMPMTVERAMNRISIVMADAIGKADMSPLIDGLESFENAINNPAIIGGLTATAGAIVNLTVKAGEAVAALAGMSQALGEWAASLNNGPDPAQLIEVANAIEFAGKKLAFLEAIGAKNSEGAKALRAELLELNSVYELQSELIENAAKARDNDTKAAGKQATQAEEISEIVVKAKTRESKALVAYEKTATAAAKKIADAESRRVDKVKDTIDALNRQLAAIKMNDRAQVIYNATMDAAEYSHGEELAAIVDKTVALYDQKTAIEAAGEETKRSAEAAEDAMQPWNEALQDMAANIDQGFSQAWTDAFSGAEDGFKSFAKNMKDAFLNLLGNMAHLAITRPIVMQISAAMGGLGGAGTAMAGTGMTGGLGGGVSSILGSINKMGAGLYSSIGTLTNDMGLFSVSNAFNAKAAATTPWTMGGDILGGAAGGYLGSKVYGETSGIGAGIGAVAGSALIPVPVLGAAIGSFVGGAIEKGLGNAFGYGGNNNDGKNVARANFDFSTGTFGKGTGSGNSWKKGEGKEQADYIDQIMGQLVAFGDAIGGSNLKGGISADSGGNLSFNGKGFSDASELLAYGFKEIVAASDSVSDELRELILGFKGTAEETAGYAASMVSYFTGANKLDAALKDLLLAFQGTAEETIAYTNAMVAMSQAVQTNPVDVALEDMVTALKNADAGISGAYYEQLRAVKTLISEYDGTASAAVELNDAFQTSRASAYQLAQTILEMSDAIGTMLGDQAKYFREAVMTEDELRRARESQRSDLLTQLRTATDPQKVLEIVNEFATVNKQLFDSLSEEQRLAQVNTFTALTNEVDAIAQSILGTSLNDLKISQDELNARMVSAVTGAAGALQSAADDMGGHVTTFGGWVQQLIERGLTINITGDTAGAEVNI